MSWVKLVRGLAIVWYIIVTHMQGHYCVKVIQLNLILISFMFSLAINQQWGHSLLLVKNK